MNTARSLAATIFLVLVTFPLLCFAQVHSEKDFRSLWFKTEKSYIKEQDAKAREEAAKQDVQIYMEMGRNYMVNNDYAAAIVCFRDIVNLESGMKEKTFTNEAKKLISEIDEKLNEDIKHELGGLLKQSIDRRKRGSQRILSSLIRPKPVVPAPADKAAAPRSAAPAKQPAKELVQESVQPQITELDPQLAKRRAALESEIAAKKVIIDAELEIKKLEFAKKQMEIDSLLYLAREMIKNGDYPAAIRQAEKVFVIDKGNPKARDVIDQANKKIERDKYLAKKREEDARLAAEKERKRQEDMAKAAEEKRLRDIQSHFDKGIEFFRENRFLEATGEFKYVLELDPYNTQAKFYLLEIKTRLERAITDLKGPPAVAEIQIKSKLKKAAKDIPPAAASAFSPEIKPLPEIKPSPEIKPLAEVKPWPEVKPAVVEGDQAASAILISRDTGTVVTVPAIAVDLPKDPALAASEPPAPVGGTPVLSTEPSVPAADAPAASVSEPPAPAVKSKLR